jgi:PAS domain-containing protein
MPTPNRNGLKVLLNSRQQYAQLIASVDGIVWEADADTFQFTFVSEQAERLLGYPVNDWLTPSFWTDHVHPDDRGWTAEFCLKPPARGGRTTSSTG